MKVLTTLIVIQLVVLALLAHRMIQIDDRLDLMSSIAQPSPADAATAIEESTGSATRGTAGVSESDIRRIIRSELNAYAGLAPGDSGRETAPARQIDPIENAARLDVVKQTLSFYIEKGEISDTDMQKLQREITRLDPDSRTEMLGELVRALNSGELEGRL